MPRRLLALLAPPLCWSCGAGAAAGEPLCDGCDRALPWLGERHASSPLATRPGDRSPGGSSPAAGLLDQIWTPLAYDGPSRDLVHALKFRRAPGLAAVMAWQMLDGSPRDQLAAPAAIVPVPAHPWRRRARGFDHAEALARELGTASGRPVIRALIRCGAFAHQRGLGRAERLRGSALTVEHREGAVPRSAVLVDDVCTTGATLEACALALRKGGASSVSAIVYARAL